MPSIYPVGDAALAVRFGHMIHPDIHREVVAFSTYISQNSIPFLIDQIPSYHSVTLLYDARKIHFDEFKTSIEGVLTALSAEKQSPPHIVEIPVCYGGEFGPDLEFVASHNGLTTEDVIRIHSETQYLVYMLGFVPGFPYLGGLSDRIVTPRLSVPRTAIPQGSVGIAGEQTGIYPISTPGGWRIIGRSPLLLFDLHRQPPTLLQVGDYVKFEPISEQQYYRIRKQLDLND